MASLRLIEIVTPQARLKQVEQLIDEHKAFVHKRWDLELDEQKTQLKLILNQQDVEALLDALEKSFSGLEDFHIMLLPIEAVVPRIEEKELEEPGGEEEERSQVSRISREELYQDVTEASRVSPVFFVMVVLSTIVAAIGLLKDSLAVVIGAMVIAPLLGPNMSLSLATTLADTKLAKQSLIANLWGFFLTIGVAVGVGVLFSIDTTASEITARTTVGFGDVLLALTAGTAGALAFTSGVSASLIGVMVAVALLPPAVVFGLLLGNASWVMALHAFILLVTNIIGINLSGVTTFLIQGVRPLTWWEEEKAKRATRSAIVVWTILLFALLVSIYLAQNL